MYIYTYIYKYIYIYVYIDIYIYTHIYLRRTWAVAWCLAMRSSCASWSEFSACSVISTVRCTCALRRAPFVRPIYYDLTNSPPNLLCPDLSLLFNTGNEESKVGTCHLHRALHLRAASGFAFRIE